MQLNSYFVIFIDCQWYGSKLLTFSVGIFSVTFLIGARQSNEKLLAETHILFRLHVDNIKNKRNQITQSFMKFFKHKQFHFFSFFLKYSKYTSHRYEHIIMIYINWVTN